MAEKNSTIINKIWLAGTNDFQQRIPEPTQGNIQATIDALFDPMNRQYYNQFIDALVMRIGDTYVHQQTFRNPLAVFKKSRMRYGSTLQEIIPKWIRAHAYRDDAEDVFKIARPDVAAWYHSQNRRDRYDITVNNEELRTAFTEEGGLNRLIAGILETPMNSDEYDEFLIMKELIAFYEQNWGFYKQQISAITNEATAKAFLKDARALAGKLQFPSTLYNSGSIPDVPVFVKPSELVLILTPEVQASIDVDALAVLFNVDKAEIQYRTILIDEFPIPGAQALLTTEDFFMCKDTVYETTSMYNPKTLGVNYFLHHWGIYSVSPFVPAILFTTASGTSVPTVTQTVTGIGNLVFKDMDGQTVSTTVNAGNDYQIFAPITATLSPSTYDGVYTAPNSATFEVTVTGEDDAPINSPATRASFAVYDADGDIDNTPHQMPCGTLHVAKGLPSGAEITVTATLAYVNPSGATTEYTKTATLTVA